MFYLYKIPNESNIKWGFADYALQTFIAIIVIAIIAVGKYHFRIIGKDLLWLLN